MLIMNLILGCLSYGVAMLLFLVDIPLRIIHELLRIVSDQFLDDGDRLTGWRVRVDG